MSTVIIRIDRRQKAKTCILGNMSIKRLFSKAPNVPLLCHTLELPWRNNKKKVSCIPAGIYPAFVRTDGSNGWCIELRDTTPRTNVQIHVGNSAKDIEGCILVGKTMGSEWVNFSEAALALLKKEIFRDEKKPEIRVEIYDNFPWTAADVEFMNRA